MPNAILKPFSTLSLESLSWVLGDTKIAEGLSFLFLGNARSCLALLCATNALLFNIYALSKFITHLLSNIFSFWP